jgi:hypothetical protein
MHETGQLLKDFTEVRCQKLKNAVTITHIAKTLARILMAGSHQDILVAATSGGH